MKYATTISMICLAFILSSCAVAPTQGQHHGKSMWARITYYTRHEDKYGAAVACPTVKHATQGKTIAAHSDFPFGSKVTIPLLANKVGNGQFSVQDRGKDVEKKKASHGTAYVFDVFLAMSNRQMSRFESSMPPYMPVYIEN